MTTRRPNYITDYCRYVKPAFVFRLSRNISYNNKLKFLQKLFINKYLSGGPEASRIVCYILTYFNCIKTLISSIELSCIMYFSCIKQEIYNINLAFNKKTPYLILDYFIEWFLFRQFKQFRDSLPSVSYKIINICVRIKHLVSLETSIRTQILP